MSRLLIVDGHAYAYRAFHAIRDLRSPEGRPTNAIYGFVKMLEKMRGAIEPTHLMVVWDGGLSPERLVLLPDYKAQRPAMPDDLKMQLDGIVEYLAAAGVPQFCQDGVEADDYIATLARQAARENWNVVIASADKDFMQLVSDRIGLLNPNDKSAQVWRAGNVVEKTGVSPERIVDWLALMGDVVDNIPGVPGVGPKTAADLILKFGSAGAVLDRLTEVKSDRLRSALIGAAENVRRNLDLVRLPDLAHPFEPDALVVRAADKPKLSRLYSGWGFKGLLAVLQGAGETQVELI